jgi:hypothetical protein
MQEKFKLGDTLLLDRTNGAGDDGPVLIATRHYRERLHASVVVAQEWEMAHHKSNIGFFAVIGGSLLAAALLIALLVGGQVAGPKVVFNASPPITAR